MAFGSLTDPKFSEYKVGPLNLPADEMTITKLSDQLWGSRPREGNEMRALKTMVDLILNEEDLKTICSESFGGAIHGAGLNNHEPAPPGLIGAERKTQIVVNFKIEVRHQCNASPELACWQGGRRGGQAIRSGQDLPGLYIRRGEQQNHPKTLITGYAIEYIVYATARHCLLILSPTCPLLIPSLPCAGHVAWQGSAWCAAELHHRQHRPGPEQLGGD